MNDPRELLEGRIYAERFFAELQPSLRVCPPPGGGDDLLVREESP